MEKVGGQYGFVFCGTVTLLPLAVIFAMKRSAVLNWLPRRNVIKT